MKPEVAMAAIDGALSLIEALAPYVQELVQKGDITIEAQKTLKARMVNLNNAGLFSGPEWQTE